MRTSVYRQWAMGCLLSLVGVQTGALAEEAGKPAEVVADSKSDAASEKKEAELVKIEAAEGRLSIPVVAAWASKKPAITMIEHEYAASASDKNSADGRLTMMMAGGSVDANVDRWLGQFSKGPDGQPPQVKRETLQVNGQAVELVDVEGTYQDRRGPGAPAVARDNYRMLGAIVSVKGGGLYFLKFYGPKATMAEHADGFRAMVEGIQSVD